MGERVNPANVRQSDLNKLADAIETYLDTLWELMVIPDEIRNKHGREIDEGFRRARKFVKKCRKGDMSIFKDEDEWDSIP